MVRWLVAAAMAGCAIPQTLGRWPDDAAPAPEAGAVDAGELSRTYAAVAVGSLRTCALSEGRAFCWGDPTDGVLGPAAGGAAVTRPTAVAGVVDAASIALGDRHACALARGRVWCWGDGSAGQLGGGVEAARAAPRAVAEVAGADALAGGRFAACARVASRWWCWGALGDVTAGAPRVVAALDGAAAVGVGFGHACGAWRAAEGARVRCVGDGYLGQLGDDARAPRAGAVDFLDEAGAPVADAQAFAVGTAGTCVLRADRRTVHCRGEIAAGSRQGARWTAPEVLAELSVGVGYVCAVAVGGGVWCWGNNSAGQLGDGTRDHRDAPVRSAQGAGVAFAEVRACGGHTCARAVGGGSIWCWGSNRSGQLGVGGSESVEGAARALMP